MNIDKYLKKIQNEFDFSIDSPKKKRKKVIIINTNESLFLIEQNRAMIDLDGTIHKYSKGWQDGNIYDEPFDGAKKVINWLRKNGFEIVIFTTRASKQNSLEMGGDHEQQIKSVENWLKHHDIYFDRITAEKIAADFYIDDKAIHIEDGNWDTVFKIIKKRIKYEKD